MPRVLQPCGTRAAYKRHVRHGETPCRACKAANAEYVLDRQRGKPADVLTLPGISDRPVPAWMGPPDGNEIIPGREESLNRYRLMLEEALAQARAEGDYRSIPGIVKVAQGVVTDLAVLQELKETKGRTLGDQLTAIRASRQARA